MTRTRRAAPGFAAAFVVAALLSVPAGAQLTKRAVHRVTASVAQTAASDVGQWSAPMSWPLVSVHAVMQPTGQILMWDGFANGPNSQRLWDPATGEFTAVPNSRNIFCAGHTSLYDGRTIVFGGHVSPNNGLPDTHLFDSRSVAWTRGADMANARWYPTGITLADGRVLVASGDSITQSNTLPITPLSVRSRSVPEVYDVRANRWTTIPTAARDMPLYPFLFVLPDGRVLDAGPEQQSRILDLSSGAWTNLAISPIDGHSAVMYRPGKVLKSGKWTDPDFDVAVHGRAAVLDATSATPAWREIAPMAFPRSYHQLVALPDGDVLAVGGGRTSEGTILANGIKPAEIFDADTETWTTMAPMQTSRLYHSGALLLPDARIVVFGGGALPNVATDQTSAEIYSPPYLFKGARPTIASAPSLVQYASGFSVETPDAARIAKVGLVRTGAVTHSLDMNQRYVPLQFTSRADGLDVTSPLNANIAPPGYYMLFIVDSNGVPSVASFVRLPAPFEAAPVPDTGPPSVSITAPANGTAVSGNVTVSANASDDTGVAGVSFRVDGIGIGSEDTAAPFSIDWSTRSVGNGTHTLTAVARDSAGKETVSAPVTVTVSNAVVTGGLVAAYSFETNEGATASDVSGTGNVGVLSGPTWSPVGRFDGALSFDAVNDWVTVADSPSLDLTDAVTLEAWVLPRLVGQSWRTVVIKEQPGDLVYGLYAHSTQGLPNGVVYTEGAEHEADGTAALPLHVWSHLAMSWDGSTVRFFVNGDLAGTAVATGTIPNSADPVRIGGNAVWGEWFDGMIDEIRVYNRALTQAEIQTDMNTPVARPPADTTPPTAPATLSATGQREAVALSWSASADAFGVVRYNVHRSTDPSFSAIAANRIAQVTTTSHNDAPLAPGTYYYRVTAEDAAGNISASSPISSATAAADLPPSAPGGLTATGALNAVDLSWIAATDDLGVARYNVHRSTTAGFTPDATNRVAQVTTTSYRDEPLAAATYYYRVVAEDTGGNVGEPSAEASALAAADQPPSAPPSLTATGAIGAVSLSWEAATDDVGVARYVIYRSPTPDFTVSVYNRVGTTTETTFRDAPLEAGTYYYTVSAVDTAGNRGAPSPQATAIVEPDLPPSAPAGFSAVGSLAAVELSWSASTDDVGVVRYTLYRSTTAGFTPSADTRIAQTSALSYKDAPLVPGTTYYYVITAEDTAGNVGPASAEAVATVDADRLPTAPALLAATGSRDAVDLSWSASSDDFGVASYNVHRSTSADLVPSADNRIATATQTSYRDAPLAPGTYYYVVTAVDLAGQIGAASPVAGAAAFGDTVAPTVTVSAPAGVLRGTVTISASASDDTGVASVQFMVDGAPLGAADTAAPYAIAWDTRNVSNGAHRLAAVATDAAGNAGTSLDVSVNVDNRPELVAAYSFNAGTGSTVVDSSGNGNNGTITGAQWVGGRFGRALEFDGDFVTVPDGASLDLDSQMTVEAWVNADSNNSWRPVVVKENAGGLSYGLYASNRNGFFDGGPTANVFVGGAEVFARGTSRINDDMWMHLAATYDGAMLRIYVNGTLVGSRATTGLIATSSGALRIGALPARFQEFRGVIDEIRIYRRALSPTEIRSDMNTPVPSAPAP